jgi:glycosyltransferase involved in cell wall biosynthesis
LKISIVTPSLDQERYIARAISSVIGQEGDFDLELIVVDGGSTDGTVGILKEFDRKIRQRPTARIKFFWQSEKDRGHVQAVNKGLRLAGGDVLAFLNSDDSYAPGAFQKVVDFFATNPKIIWVTGKCRIIDRQERVIRKWVTTYKNILLKNYSYPLLLTENFLSQPATFWRKRVYEEFGDFNESQGYSLDYEYWLRLGQKYKPGFINDYLANFRLHPASKSGRGEIMGFGEGLDLVRRFGKSYVLARPLYLLNYAKLASAYRVMRWLRR